MADRPYRRAVVPTEIGNGLEIRRELSRQPHAFDIAPRFALQSPARLHAVQIAVEIELEHCRRAIPRSPGRGRPAKPSVVGSNSSTNTSTARTRLSLST